MREKFSYHPVFIPEYISTIIISTTIAFIAGFWSSFELIKSTSIHKSISTAIYAVMIVVLLWLTFHYRKKYSSITINQGGIEKAAHHFLPFVAFYEIAKVVEHNGYFFSRNSRYLSIETKRGEIIEIYDFIYEYNTLRELINKKVEITQHEFLKQAHYFNFAGEQHENLSEKLAESSARRDKSFGDPDKMSNIIGNWFNRLCCLLPVFLTDVLAKGIIDSSFTKSSVLVFYSNSIALFLSFLVARYVYYYLLSSQQGRISFQITKG